MLQQTTVEAVRRRYDAFLARFPDLETLARAREGSVLAAWSGLGYYARARNLRNAAREVLVVHGGRLPRDPRTLRTLPGFGEYMAAAVACLAFGARIPAVEANVARTLSRLFAIPGLLGTRSHAAAVRQRAAALVARGDAAGVTAALMDLGQLVCTPHDPRCPSCPLAEACVARRLGRPTRFPRRPAPPSSRSVFVAAACALREGRVLLVRRHGALLGGLWQFPTAEGETPADAAAALRRAVRGYGLVLDEDRPGAVTQHTIVNRRLRIAVYRAAASRRPRPDPPGAASVRWLPAAGLATAAIPTLTRKIATAAGVLAPPAPVRSRGRRARVPAGSPTVVLRRRRGLPGATDAAY
jgi:A/G-specific adenine glycosylase